eukprot:1260209-Prymnesium_polylepis.1
MQRSDCANVERLRNGRSSPRPRAAQREASADIDAARHRCWRADAACVVAALRRLLVTAP